MIPDSRSCLQKLPRSLRKKTQLGSHSPCREDTKKSLLSEESRIRSLAMPTGATPSSKELIETNPAVRRLLYDEKKSQKRDEEFFD